MRRAWSMMRRRAGRGTARRAIALALILLGGVWGVGPAGAQEQLQYTSINVPGSLGVFYFGGVNGLGQAVMNFYDAGGVQHAAVRGASGALTLIDIPGAAVTLAFGMNDAGQVVGAYQDGSTFATHGFVRDPAGAVIPIDFPGGVAGTQALGINNLGDIVGFYFSGGAQHGFVRDAGGRFTSIDAPAATGQVTAAVGINDFGQIAGYYYGTSDTSSFASYHGFVRQADGTFVVVDFFPTPTVTFPYTFLTGINDLGQVTGYYALNPFTGFVGDLGGNFTAVAFPTNGARSITAPDGLDAAGDIAGVYRLASGENGFAAAPVLTQLPAVTTPPPLPPGTAPEIRRVRRELCLHNELGTFFDWGAVLGFASAAAFKQPSTQKSSAITKNAVYMSQAVGLLSLGSTYTGCVQDAFDPNFATRYTPQFHALPSIPSSADVPAPLAALLTDALRHGSRAAGYLQAVDVSLNRYSSALRAHDAADAAAQALAVLDFVKLGRAELDVFAQDLKKSADLARGTALDQPVSPADVQAAFDAFRKNGTPAFPALERGVFAMFGLDPSLLITGSRPDGARRAEGERVSRSFSSALRNIAYVMDRLGHSLHEGLPDEE